MHMRAFSGCGHKHFRALTHTSNPAYAPAVNECTTSLCYRYTTLLCDKAHALEN